MNKQMRNHKQLVKYVKQNGFELIRHNGCHHIYANDIGQTLVIPYRTGSHILAPKTVKRVLDVIESSNRKKVGNEICH